MSAVLRRRKIRLNPKFKAEAMLILKPAFSDRVVIHGAERERPGHYVRVVAFGAAPAHDRVRCDIGMVLELPAGMGGAALRIEHAVPHQPIARILGILIKPLRGTSQPERIAPLIHVAAHAFAADVRQRLRQDDL